METDERTARRRQHLESKRTMLQQQHDWAVSQLMALEGQIAQVMSELASLDDAKASVDREHYRELMSAAWASDRKNLA